MAEFACDSESKQRYTKAIELTKIAINLAKDADDPLEEGAALRVLGQALQLSGDYKQAIKHLKKSLLILGDNDYKYESYMTLLSIERLYHDIGDVNNGKAISDKAQVLKRKMGLL